MRFAIVARALMFASILADSLDYVLTEAGYTRFSYLLENNPYVILARHFLSPEGASAAVFGTSLGLIVVSYMFGVASVLRSAPYNGTLSEVARYMVGPTVRGRDIFLFAVMAGYAVLIQIHLSGAVRWLRLLNGMPPF